MIVHNKTLAAQLYGEFKELFPNNAVEFFVSYYDYYQPEAYIPSTDTYIEKDASRNETIDKMRHSATRSLLERNDVLIVASVSAIYGLGSPDAYHEMHLHLQRGETRERDEILRRLAGIQYRREVLELSRGTFRVRGDILEIFPVYEEDKVIRIEFFGDEIEAILEVDPLKGVVLGEREEISIYPGTHYVAPEERFRAALESIGREKEERVQELKTMGRLLEAQRLEMRTNYDLEMLREMGFCQGIENYSRHLDGRKPGEPPATLLNYFPDNFLVFVDESHVTIPQLEGMYRGDRSRKETLVEHGFRLPSALDNRPLTFEEYSALVHQAVYVSATAGEYELEKAAGNVAEQIIRPTGLMDPEVEVRSAKGQVDDLLSEIHKVVRENERVLVTTLTKRMAEDLTEYLRDMEVRVRYLHSDIDTLERSAIIRDLRLGRFDVLVGINLLREGLDLPEVSLVAILDADKEGFLRSERSLIQTFGRAARNVHGRAILYAERITASMERAMEETKRRRAIQEEYNEKMGITPEGISKAVQECLASRVEADYCTVSLEEQEAGGEAMGPQEIPRRIQECKEHMKGAAADLEFEEAARYRDEILRLERLLLELQ